MMFWMVAVYDDSRLVIIDMTSSRSSAFDFIRFYRMISYNECGDEDDYTFTLKRISLLDDQLKKV